MSDEQYPEQRSDFDKLAAEVNSKLAYANWAVFRLDVPLPEEPDELQELITATEAALDAYDAVTIRGWYDLAAFRADADLMLWTFSPDVDQLQRFYHSFCASPLGELMTPVWSAMALHRQAEFNPRHIPDFLVSPQARPYASVYPFVRSYEWYCLPPEERGAILKEHGAAAHDYPDVRANTVEAFALGDYEWILCFEADELHRIVDLMRVMRGTKARLHVREEIPFFTGPLVTLPEWAQRVLG